MSLAPSCLTAVAFLRLQVGDLFPKSFEPWNSQFAQQKIAFAQCSNKSRKLLGSKLIVLMSTL